MRTLAENPLRPLVTWRELRVFTGWVCRLSSVPSFQPKMDVLAPAAYLHELGILLAVATPLGRMHPAIVDSTVSATIHEGEI